MTSAKQTIHQPVYLFVGDDEQKKDEMLTRLKKSCEKYGEMTINTDVFEGEAHMPERAVSACLTLPFASEKRLVIIKDLEKYETPELNVLADYVAEPSDMSILVMLATSLAKNTRLYKNIAKAGDGGKTIVDCSSPKSWEFVNFATSVAKSKGATITKPAAEKLVALTGKNTVAISKELEKILASHTTSSPISEAEVESLVSLSAKVTPWVVVDAFSARNIIKVMELLPRVEGMDSIGLLTVTVNRIRELICAKEVAAKHGTGATNELMQELGINQSWRVKNHFQWARQYSMSELREAIKSSVQAEKDMKSGSDQTAVLTLWLARTLSQ